MFRSGFSAFVRYGFVAVLGGLLLTPVQAQTVDFNGYGNTIFGDEDAGNGLEVGTDDGFNFVSSGDHFHFIQSGNFGIPGNGTSVLYQDRDYTITMTAVGGGTFNLSSADYAETEIQTLDATSILVTGNLSGGGTVSQTLFLDGNRTSFQSATFVGFTNLVSVSFDGLGGGGGFSLDNIATGAGVVNAPEPGTMALFGAVLLPLASQVARRRTR